MSPTVPRSPVRRRLLLAAGLSAGAFTLAAWLFYRERDRMRPPAALVPRAGESAFNAWIKIGADGIVLVQVPRQEQVRFEQAPVDAVYANATMLGDAVPFRPDDRGWLADLARLTQYRAAEVLGLQATGGSSSVRDAWQIMRHAGAAARAMLIGAAAKRWGVEARDCRTEAGAVHHPASNRRLGYGALAAEAAALPPPPRVALKEPREFRLLGKAQARLDTAAKVDGTALFACDVRLPGMRYAALAQSPVFGGAAKSADLEGAKRKPGVVAVLELAPTSTSPAAVAVVADGWWNAKRVLEGMTIRWNDGANGTLDSARQREAYAALLDGGSARVYEELGDAPAVLAGAGRVLEAVYEVPYLAHATMEPMNATALLKDGRCEVWAGNQAPTLAKWFAAKAAGLPGDAVTVHTPFLGGGFGRRIEVDVIVQAVSIAAQLPGVPIQLVWTREEDLRHDVYRPMATARLRCALQANGTIGAWHHRIVGQSCTQGLTSRLMPAAASDLMKDKTVAEGAYDLPYAMPNRLVEHVLAHQPVPAGYWRSVGHS